MGGKCVECFKYLSTRYIDTIINTYHSTSSSQYLNMAYNNRLKM